MYEVYGFVGLVALGVILHSHFYGFSSKIKLEIRYRKRLKELKKRDPFIYK